MRKVSWLVIWPEDPLKQMRTVHSPVNFPLQSQLESVSDREAFFIFRTESILKDYRDFWTGKCYSPCAPSHRVLKPEFRNASESDLKSTQSIGQSPRAINPETSSPERFYRRSCSQRLYWRISGRESPDTERWKKITGCT